MATIVINGITYNLKRIDETTYKATIDETDLIPFASSTGTFYHMPFSDWQIAMGGLSVGYRGAIDTSSNPVGDGIFIPSESGTYTNFSSIVVDLADGLNLIVRTGVTSTKIVIPIDLTAYVAKSEIVNDLTTGGTNAPLSAEQGKILDTNKIAFSDLSVAVMGKNIFDPTAIIQDKNIDPVNGAITNAVGYAITEPILIPSTATVITISGLGNIHNALGWRINDISGNLLKRSAVGADLTEFTATTTAISDWHSFQFTVKTTKVGDNIDPSLVQVELGPKTPFEPYQSAIVGIDGKDISVTKVYTDSDSPLSPVNVEYLNDSAVLSEQLSYSAAGKNLLDPNDLIDNAYIDLSTGEVVNVVSAYKISQPIESGPNLVSVSGLGTVHHAPGWAFIKPDETVVKRGIGAADGTSFSADGTGLDSDVSFHFTVITGKAGDNTIPANVQVEIGAQTSFEPYQPGVSEINGLKIVSVNGSGDATTDIPTFGKKIILFGDSITTEMATNGTVLTNWPLYARPIMGITDYRNWALSGASFTDWDYSDGARQQLSVQIDEAITDGFIPDIIVIAMGTNDYSRLATFGDYDTAMSKATLLDLDRTIVIEAARYAFWKCRDQWPNARCYYGNPLQRANTPNSSEADNNGDWLRDPIQRMAERYGFIIIDAFSESGIVKDFEINGSPGRYLNDGLHPKTNGKELQGRFYANSIINDYINQ